MPGMRVIRCDCGFEAIGDRDDDLVERGKAHARDAHGIDVTAEHLLGLARPAHRHLEG